MTDFKPLGLFRDPDLVEDSKSRRTKPIQFLSGAPPIRSSPPLRNRTQMLAPHANHQKHNVFSQRLPRSLRRHQTPLSHTRPSWRKKSNESRVNASTSFNGSNASCNGSKKGSRFRPQSQDSKARYASQRRLNAQKS